MITEKTGRKKRMITRVGNDTLRFERGPWIAGWASSVGKREKEGPLGDPLINVMRIPCSERTAGSRQRAVCRRRRRCLRCARRGWSRRSLTAFLPGICSISALRPFSAAKA